MQGNLTRLQTKTEEKNREAVLGQTEEQWNKMG